MDSEINDKIVQHLDSQEGNIQTPTGKQGKTLCLRSNCLRSLTHRPCKNVYILRCYCKVHEVQWVYRLLLAEHHRLG